MSIFPIENMVKLTYNIKRGDFMAEYCYECFKKYVCDDDFPAKEENEYIYSDELELCEGCGELKKVVIVEKNPYNLGKTGYFFYKLYNILKIPYLYIKEIKNNLSR